MSATTAEHLLDELDVAITKYEALPNPVWCGGFTCPGYTSNLKAYHQDCSCQKYILDHSINTIKQRHELMLMISGLLSILVSPQQVTSSGYDVLGILKKASVTVRGDLKKLTEINEDLTCYQTIQAAMPTQTHAITVQTSGAIKHPNDGPKCCKKHISGVWLVSLDLSKYPDDCGKP